MTQQFWESFYAEGRSRWSGKVNVSVAAEVAGLQPGTALDLGAGQGGDAIWLAQQGWTVTAVDISATALEVAARHAAEAGVDGAITWERRDLGESWPDGTFDLVAATYLHSPVPLDRTTILRNAAAAVAPGGTLLVVGHAPSKEHHHHAEELQGPDAVIADLALPPEAWRLVTSELRTFEHAFADEEAKERVDAVVRFERRR
jgi:cyclopropane fatty-acyl-phospholipid synthase-like methyltransferase